MKILVTGGSGTIGSAFIRKYKNDYEFINVNRTEINSVKLSREFPDIKTYLGGIEDVGFLLKVFSEVKPDVVIHAAALKHVDLIEKNPTYACKVNITGGLNVIDASLRTNVPVTLFISTDKACSPSNVYGSTKYLMEKCFLNSNSEENKFSIVRFANVAHSTGSVIPYWLSLKENKNPLLLTNPNMNRLMLSQENAATTIKNVLEYTIKNGGGIVGLYKSKSVNMYSLAKIIFDNVKTIGDREGEKINEDLINDMEILYSYVEGDFIYIKNEKNINSNTRLLEKYSSLTAEKMSRDEMERLIWK